MMHRIRHQMMLRLMLREIEIAAMRTTVNLDDALLDKARQLSGIEERTALLHEALRALIARESARRLARLGGSEPRLKTIPRRRSAGK
jgi:Arc/MetJ family transcription regulator